LTAEDVALLLQQQVFAFDSALYAGPRTKGCVEVRYSLPFRRRVFEQAEQYWIHCLHPTFFGYSALDRTARRSRAGEEALVRPSSVRTNDRNLKYCDPVDSFSSQNKETFAVLKQDLPDQAKESLGKAALRRGGSRSAEESSVEHRELKMYRPNLSHVTQEDIGRLERLYRAFKNNYEELMHAGLVDGVRLNPRQYAAMVNRDTAFR
jgi:hypothetical protein